MFISNDSIKFMMAKIFLHLAEFKYDKIKNPTNLIYHGTSTLIINYVISGSAKLIMDDISYDIKEKSYFVSKELSTYQIIPNTEFEYYSMYFVVDSKTGYEKYLYLLKTNFIGNDIFHLDNLFSLLYEELKTKRFGYNEVAVSMFKSIIVTILRNENIKGEKISHWDLENFQFQIENIMQNEFMTISLENLSERLFLSPRELQRYLKDNYNMTFIEFKNKTRMNFAKTKLLYSNLSISEISDLTGYSSVEHFSYAFKEYFGMSPLKFKKANKKL